MIQYKILLKKTKIFFNYKIESSDIDDAIDFDMIKSIYPKFLKDERKNKF